LTESDFLLRVDDETRQAFEHEDLEAARRRDA